MVKVGDYCQPQPHRNGCTWVGRVWLQKHFPAECVAAILTDTYEVEITQRKALLLMTLIPKPGDGQLVTQQLEADIAKLKTYA